MEIYRIENLSFKYPEDDNYALKNINFSVEKGEFLTICGTSGSGKSTLLKQLKPILAPHGDKEGQIFFDGQELENIDERTAASRIGYVLQNPENQIVTDKVWHELAFGLESLGYTNDSIRLRVGEMASFFGIQNWFYKNTVELSGGQKQILNLASIMAMQPDVLILDEPTSQLDPIAATDFLNTLKRINLELGTTIIMTEHRLEEVIPISDRLLTFEKGEIIVSGTPEFVARTLKISDNPMFYSMTTAMQIYGEIENGKEYPITVRDGRNFIENRFNEKIDYDFNDEFFERENIIEIKDIWFRYSKTSPDIVKSLNLDIKKSELLSIVGGNGTGKTTTLSLISKMNKYYRGKIMIEGQNLEKIPDIELYGNVLGVLPQNPENLFVKSTVKEDLMEMFKYGKIDDEKKEIKISNISKELDIEFLLDRHPYDLSGGEKQRVGLAKILLNEPKILLLDEPTKGMDEYFKDKFGIVLDRLKKKGMTILMVSHDIEFCAKYADRCALFFDGDIITINNRREFFAGNNFYTTSANRIARNICKDAITIKDVINICQKKSI